MDSHQEEIQWATEEEAAEEFQRGIDADWEAWFDATPSSVIDSEDNQV
jgi:hypothetical protein